MGLIKSNPVQPRVNRAVATERGECSVGLDERLLRYIFDLGRIADEPRQQPCQLALILLDKQLESPLVATLRPRDQFPVDFAVRHPAAAPRGEGSPPRLQRLCATDTRTLK